MTRRSYVRDLLGLTALASLGASFGAGAATAQTVLPQGGQFVAGAGMIGPAGANGLTIDQSTARGVIDWRSFSIGVGGSVQINNGQGATLNRVTGGQISEIQGRLSATGSVYLLNPQGVVIGADGKVVAGGSVVVSTRNVANTAFMGGGPLQFSGTSPGEVTNLGEVLSRQGNVVLIGRSVRNAGTLSAPAGSATLAAANSVLLTTTDGPGRVYVAPDASASGDVTQEGRITAAAAALTAAGGNVYTLAGNREGLVQATGTQSLGGQVWLSAPNGAVAAGGAVSARNADGSGGEIVVHGGRSTVLTGALDASGIRGGSVLVGVTGPQQDLSDSTVVADGASILTGGPQGGGQVETSGHLLTVGRARVDTAGGAWLLDPIDVTIDATAASTIVGALASTDVTVQTTSNSVTTSGVANTIGVQNASGSGDITVASDIVWSSARNLTLSAYRNIAVNAAITNTSTGGLTLTAANAGSITSNASGLISLTGGNLTATTSSGPITIGAAISANLVSLRAQGTSPGILTLNAGVTGTAAGTRAVLLGASNSFVNNAGSTGVQASGAGGYWNIYSVNPTANNSNLTPDFFEYGKSYGNAPSGSGNGLMYSAAQTLGYSLTGAVTKTYDGTNAATLTAANLSATGLVSGDTVAPTTGVGTFSQSDVGSSLTVTLTGGVSVTRAGAPVYGYATGSQTNQGVIGSITAAPLTIGLTGSLGKVYDGSTLATLTSGNFTVSGVVSGQSVTVSQPASAVYDSANAGSTRTLAATLSPTSYVAGSGTKLTNYSLPSSASASNITITPAPVQILNVRANDKTYNASATATLDLSNVSLFGLVNGSDVNLDISGVSAAFGSANAGSNLAVTASGFALVDNGGLASNYTLTQPTGLTASIGRAGLSITGVSAQDKTYDGTTAASLTGTATLVGVQAADTSAVTLVTAGATGTFASKNAGTGIAVATSGYALTGSAASNYTLAQPSAGAATINRAPLSVTLNGSTDKVYNGSTAAYVNPANYSVSGLISGESVSVIQTASATYGSADASPSAQTISVTLRQTDYSAGAGTLLSNYILPTTTVNTPTGFINKAPLAIAIVGNPTKVYNADDAATLTASNFQITGLVGAETVDIGQTAGTYDQIHAGVRTVSAALSDGDFVNGANGFLLSNYSYATPVTGLGLITPAPLGTGGAPPYNLNIDITGNPSKVYDGNTSILLTAGFFHLDGLQGGDQIDVSATGAFGTANVGVQPISVSLTSANYTPQGGTLLSDYTLPTEAFGFGEITRRPVTISLTGAPTKVYNASTFARVTSGDFTFSNFVSGQGATVSQVSSSTYDVADAGSRTVTAKIKASDLTPTGSTNFANYDFGAVSGVVTVTGAGTITRAPLTVLGASASSKTYDRTNAAVINAGSLYGVVNNEDVQLVQPTTGTFSQIGVGSGLTVTPSSAYSLTGTANLANYDLTAPTLTADITRKAISIASISANNKFYDGGTGATVTASGLSGVIGPDDVTLDGSGYTASFSQAHAAPSLKVTASGFGLGGVDAGNYSLNQPSGLTANIDRAPLTASIINNPTKTYDGTTRATLTASNYSLSGFAAGEGSDVTVIQQVSANYDTKKATANSGATTVTSALVAPDFRATSTDLTNYVLPTTATGAGTINLATLTASIIGNPTKTYDSTTAFDSSTTNTGGNAGNGLLASNYKIVGWATGEGSDVTIGQHTGTYATANAGITTLSASLSGSDFSAGATDLGNYALPTTAAGAATITKRALTISLATQTKVYDNSTTASGLSSASYTVNNLAGSETATILNHASGVYNSKHVNGASTVTVSNIVAGDYSGANGFLTSNYTLATSATGSGSITPKALSLGSVTRVYDGTNLIDGSSHTVTLAASGLLGSDTVTFDTSALSGTYTATTHVGTGLNVSLTGVALATNPNGDYSIASSQTGNFGAITPKAITGSIIGNPTKTYDGNTAFSASTANTSPNTGVGLVTGNFSLSGFISGEGADVTRSSGTFASKNAGSGIGISVTGLTSADFSATGSTQLTDYSLPTSLSGTGTINPATVLISLQSVTKVYDGTTNLPSASSGYVLGGVVSGDDVNVASATGSYVSKNVGSNLAVNISALTLGGAQSGNYVPQLPAANALIGFITPRPLTITLANQTKVYDGTVGIGLAGNQFTISNLANGTLGQEGVSIASLTGAYNSKDVGTGTTVSASLTDSSFIGGTNGFDIANYSYSGTVTNALSAITKRPLTISLANQTKVYDGAVGISLANSQFTVTNYANGTLGQEGADIATVSGTYNSKDVATATTVSASLTSGSFINGANGFNANNYSFPATVSNTSSAITQRPLTITLGAKTKVYDGTVDSSLVNGDFTVTNYANGTLGQEGAQIGPLTGTYNSKDVATATTVTANLSSGSFGSGVNGFDVANYSYAGSVSNTASTITKRPLTITLASQTKVYDGTLGIGLGASQFTVTNYANGTLGQEGAQIASLTGTYDSKDVATATTVTAGLTDSSFISGANGFSIANYSYAASVSNTASHVTPRPITGVLSAQTKVYDSTTLAAGLTSSMFTLSGFAGAEGAAVTGHTSGAYNSKNVLAASTVTVGGIATGDYVGSGGFVAGNYTLPTSIAGPGTITPAPLSVTNLGVRDKVYDGTTAAQLDLSLVTASSLVGVYAGDDVSLSSLPGGANFASPNVGAAISITLAGQAISGADVGNYTLSSAALPKANITPRPLTAAIVGNPTKVYDATTGAVLTPANFALSNFVTGEGAAVTQTVGTYADPNAGPRTVSATLAAGQFTANGGTLLSNYILPTSATGPGTINPRPLTASIIGTPTKFFDGNTGAKLTSDNYLVTGFVTGQGATLTQPVGTYSGLGPSSDLTVSAELDAGAWGAASGTLLSNYILPSRATGPGIIRPPLSSDLYTRYETQLAARSVDLTADANTTIRDTVFAMATPRVYIPFPAPGALSTWKGNGFGSLPIVVDQTTDFATVVTDTGNVAVQSGPPMINNTEQVLLQGVRNKQYRIIIPEPSAPAGQPGAAQ